MRGKAWWWCSRESVAAGESLRVQGWLISAIGFVVRFRGIPAGTGTLLAVCAARGVGVCAGALEYLGEELLDASVAWVVEERAGRLILDDLAFVEHDDPVGHLVGEA